MKVGRNALVAVLACGCLGASGFTCANQEQDNPIRITQEAGLTVSDYKYTESGMSLTATKFGIDYAIAFQRTDGWFLRGQLRSATGDADYSGTGNMGGVTDRYVESRWGVGRQFDLGRHTVWPEVGLGYRYLYNDLRGTTDTGAVGYRRESRYLTARAALRYQFLIPDGTRIEAAIEHDRLLLGRQDTRLSDIEGRGPWTDVPDVVNYQYRGEGWRFSTTYRVNAWSVGTYLHLWRIKESDKDHIQVQTRTGTEYWTVWEPTNNTREVGVKVAYRF